MRIKLLLPILLVVSGLSIQTIQAQFTKLHDFDDLTNGSSPFGSLISDGTFLYGVTSNGGGLSGRGTVFKIMPDGSAYTTLHIFTGPDGAVPNGTLIYDGTFLYGTTLDGGAGIYGTIFKIKPDGTGFQQLRDFDSGGGEKWPNGGLVMNGAFIYGTLYTGGPGPGHIFKIKPDGTAYSIIYSCSSSSDGVHPMALISDSTHLFGMMSEGGANNDGAIFKIKHDGTGFTKLFDFSDVASGNMPRNALYSDGTFFYGMTSVGGTASLGTLFKIMHNGSGFTKLLDFTGSVNGSKPYGALISDGTFLYGMTTEGGTNNLGTIFSILPDGSAYQKLYDFDSINGEQPYGSLLLKSGNLYGMTYNGGSTDVGVIFKSNLATSISENDPSSELNIFPNPSNGVFTIQTSTSQESQLEICNVLGELVYSSRISGNNSEIDLSQKAKGIYFVRLIGDKKVITTKKLVITN